MRDDTAQWCAPEDGSVLSWGCRDLQERHYGDLQGKNKAETAKKYGDDQVHIWRRSYDTPPASEQALGQINTQTNGQALFPPPPPPKTPPPILKKRWWKPVKGLGMCTGSHESPAINLS